MGKNSSRRDRRDANAVASRRIYVKTTQYYKRPTKPRLHISPSPRTPHADAVLRRPPRPPSQPAADNRFYHPLGRQRPVVSYSGTQAHRKRLLDTPRPVIGHVTKWKQSKRSNSGAVQRQRFVVNRFGPKLDRQTKAIVAFHDPERIPLCSSRKARKQVLHARGIAGGRVKKPTFKENSRISCHGT